MKICYIASTKTIHTQKWVDWFHNKGHEIFIITFDNGNIKNAKIFRIQTHTKNKFAYLSGVYKVRKIVHDLRPDVLHSHYITSNGFVGARARYHPFIVTAHGSDLLRSPRKNLILRTLVNYTLKKADHINLVSEQMLPLVRKLSIPDKKITVFQYGLDLSKFKIDSNKFEEEKIRIICSRHNKKIYNVDIILKAMERILDNYPNSAFYFFGEGYDDLKNSNKYKRYIANRQLFFMGMVDNDTLINYMKKSHIYLSMSSSDGTAISLLEAMASGDFPIVSKIESNQFWIKDGINGFLIAEKNHKLLISRIQAAIDDISLRRYAFRHNRKLIEEKGNIDKNLGKMEEVYYSLVKSSKRNPCSSNHK